MRFWFLAVSLALPSVAALAADPYSAGSMPVVSPGGPKAANCPATSRYEAMKRGKELNRRFLNELPVADHYKAVYRKIDGCEVPIIAGYGIGATGETKSPRR